MEFESRIRDLLVNEIPVVLRADLYALAAFAGAAVVVAGHRASWSLDDCRRA